jgi:tRNA pseudouridine38-40 synthase
MRYFIEVAYDGLSFSGFQIQDNAITIQGLLEDALQVVLKTKMVLTGSSRTDAQVNAHQNFFHVDVDEDIATKIIYNLNALLPPSILVRSIKKVIPEAHARFSAHSRSYEYIITTQKNPFLFKKAYYYPYNLSIDALTEAAAMVLEQTNFSKFCKSNSQVSNFNCKIYKSLWRVEEDLFYYNVTGNRFLRGMVKALVGTMLQYGIGKMTKQEFLNLFQDANTTIRANFSPPGHALYLSKVDYSKNIFLL